MPAEKTQSSRAGKTDRSPCAPTVRGPRRLSSAVGRQRAPDQEGRPASVPASLIGHFASLLAAASAGDPLDKAGEGLRGARESSRAGGGAEGPRAAISGTFALGATEPPRRGPGDRSTNAGGVHGGDTASTSAFRAALASPGSAPSSRPAGQNLESAFRTRGPQPTRLTVRVALFYRLIQQRSRPQMP